MKRSWRASPGTCAALVSLVIASVALVLSLHRHPLPTDTLRVSPVRVSSLRSSGVPRGQRVVVLVRWHVQDRGSVVAVLAARGAPARTQAAPGRPTSRPVSTARRRT